MKKYDIDLNSITSKGNVVTEINNSVLYITNTQKLVTNYDLENRNLNSYVTVSETFKLPLRIELLVKIDTPGLYLFLGNGHITFGTPWSDNRRMDDIIEPSYKARFYHNHIPMNEFISLTIIYDFKAMQVLINGEERFYSKKEKYMKSKMLSELNNTGFSLKIACSKRTNLWIKSLTVIEYDESVQIERTDTNLPKPFITNEAVGVGQKPRFDNSISLLPEEIHSEIIKMDDFLRTLKPMKFKRQIDKYGNKITYVSSGYGFSYALHPSNDVMHHTLSWYIITSSKPELWHRKADMMEETLYKIAETSPELAERMFLNLSECIGCYGQCQVRTLYQFNGKKILSCHGKMEFKMCVSDFDDVRAFINTINEILIENEQGAHGHASSVVDEN